MKKKPVIAITMGDPAGIGPEIIAKTAMNDGIYAVCKPFIIGDAEIMKKIIKESSLPITMQRISSPPEIHLKPGVLNIIDCKNIDLEKHRWGIRDNASGTAVVEYITRAVTYCLNHEADALVTGPLNKEVMNAAGHHFAGHTELLAHLTNTKNYGMMFVGGGLRLILVTIHMALKDVPAQITEEQVLGIIRLAHNAVRDLGITKPRIGVAALNPHAGEAGLFGSEETDIILPAIRKAREEGIDASDPVPADTLFYKARNNQYDIVVAMYHDQGLAPLKMIAFGNAVNITVGLPIIRTSVDHGTAYDIAGKGCADPASLIEAVKLAAIMAANRQNRLQEKP
ncbi:MAG: 4-hydroxythreonine-4-phosphate dehydrogenase PdxA [Nitrospirota bacterium]